MKRNVKEVNIHDGLDSTLLILQHRLKLGNRCPHIEIIRNYGDLPLVKCYPGQLNQVFMNILANAIDALEGNAMRASLTGQVNPAPRIQICTDRIQSNRIKVSISDNGLGILETTKAKLFDPFFTTKPVGKETGLGLSISHQIVTERHQGKLYFQSEPGKDTEFVVEIPVHDAN